MANRSAEVASGDDVRIETLDARRAPLIVVSAVTPRVGLVWLPALGVGARHYLPMAQRLAANGVAVAVHEWRGTDASRVRASRREDWGYRELLLDDVPEAIALARGWNADIPWLIGGHSIGGQFAALAAARHPEALLGLALVASGSPYWRGFPHSQRGLVRLLFMLVTPITAIWGYFPGRRIGFGGAEAKTLMRDWARSGRTGRYAPSGIDDDLESALARYSGPVFAAQLADDALCPPASLDALLSKLPSATITRQRFAADDFDNRRATHFSWMKASAPIVIALEAWLRRFIAG